MRRAVLTLSGTVVGLVALFSYKTHVASFTPVALPSSTPAGLTKTAPPVPGASPSASASLSSPSPSATKTTAPATAAATTPAASSAPATMAPATTAPAPASTKPTPTPTPTPAKTTATPTPTPTAQQIEGPDEQTNYGPVQVVITVSDGKVTAAADEQQPDDSIGANAVSELNSEVLSAGTVAAAAQISSVSGATYTSQGYIASLQAALDQAS